jgi:uncharacterized surface protein with fasciclin (FAS1) repeats
MKRRSIFLIFAVLIIAGVLFAGCATQNPATVTPTPVPVVTTEMTAVPMTTEMTAVPTTTEMTAAPTAQATGMNIVETLAADGRFTTLVTALKAAQLDGNLSGPGPFTLFAPTDAAFSKLPAGTVDSFLMNPQGQLKQILLYHVVDRKLMAADVMRFGTINTLQGQSLLIGVSNGIITLNGNAKVTTPDIVCSNGVIHVIDNVLIPQT